MVIFVVGCSKEKLQGIHPVEKLYTSQRFKDSCQIAKTYADKWFILSAKYGLLLPETQVESYDTSINDLAPNDLTVWTYNVYNYLLKEFETNTSIVFLGDPEYFIGISNLNLNNALTLYIPFLYLEKDKWAEWQKNILNDSSQRSLIDDVYEVVFQLLNDEKQFRKFKTYSGKDKLPERGLYIYFDEKEVRLFDKKHKPRIVRIGTHAVSENSKSSLWQRLKAHLGKEDGDGNHRSSIFRSHVGTALIRKKEHLSETWGVGKKIDTLSREKEIAIEKDVSNYICEKTIVWIDIHDFPSKYSDRAYIEQNLIALLSGYNNIFDFPSTNWLGNYCSNKVVQRSFLWNVNHCTESVDVNFIETLKKLVKNTINHHFESESVAPSDWYQKARFGYQQNDLKFDN